MTNAALTLPPMLRDELFHPAVVHFPIAFLSLAGLIAIFWCVSRRASGTLLLVLSCGVLGGWIAILTGGWAEDVVNRVICDPTLTHEHEKWAEWAVWVASVAWPLVIAAFFRRKKGIPAGYRAVVTVILLFVSGAILYAGHLGATLVYQQGAAVYKPAPQCTEFE